MDIPVDILDRYRTYVSGGVALVCANCMDVLPVIEAGSVDAVVTDPPYGAGKADWDYLFPRDWFHFASRIARMTIIITGAPGLKDSIPLVGGEFVDVISARNLNGLTRGPLGFNNWIAAVVACGKPKKDNFGNFFEFAVRGDMPDHPSPKPIEYMVKLIERTTNDGDVILDPFMGSGTTGVACVQTGRKFIGIEIEPKYFEIAKKRISQAQLQMRMEI